MQPKCKRIVIRRLQFSDFGDPLVRQWVPRDAQSHTFLLDRQI